MRFSLPFNRSRRTRAAAGTVAAAAMAVSAGALVALPGPAQAAAVQCKATYSVSNDWGSGFTTNVTITNLGAAWTSWTLGYAYAGNQTLSSGWNGSWTQSGKNVTVSSLSWNAAVATNGTVTPAANFNYSGVNAAPTVFTVNGVVCAGPTPTPTPTP